MLDFPRWKRWTISLALALGVFLAIPSLIGETNAKRVGLGFLPRISLGLDLSGGNRCFSVGKHWRWRRWRRRRPWWESLA